MAATIYPAALKALLEGKIDLLTNDVRAAAVDQADEAYNAADVFLSDITPAAIVAPGVSLTSKTTTGGVFDALDVTLPSVTGDPVEVILLYVHTGVSTTSRLLAYLDGISVTPNGGAIAITWSNAASRIFAL